jgi:hypothetical protein
LRTFLRERAVLVSERAPLPEQVPQAIIEAFERDGHPLPDRDNIKLDWVASLFTSSWNKTAIGFLAEMFIDKLGDYPAVTPDPEVINVTSIMAMIQSKLGPTWSRARLESIASETMDQELRTRIEQKPMKERIRKRRYGRREGVRVRFSDLL